MPDHYSVLIVGAGPTGLTLANLLGKAGVKTLLVEASASTVSEPRAVSIDDEGLRVVQALGLLDVLEPDLVQGYGSEYRSPGGTTFLKVKPLAQPYGHPRRNAFRQPTLEARLREGIVRYPSVEARFSCALEDFNQTPERVEAQLRQADGGVAIVHADYMVGCDGARSAIREALGFALQGSSLDERWLIIDLEDSPADSPETIVFCDPVRAGIALPGPHTTRRYEFKIRNGEDEEQILSEPKIDELLSRYGAADSSRIVRKTIYHFHARIADHWGKDRIWLAGDAAHLMPPFAGQGMNSGLRDAFNLGWKLAEVVKGNFGPRLLHTYEQERRSHVESMIKLALQMGRIMGPRSHLSGLLTRMFFRSLSVWPAARSFFAEMKYKPTPRFKAGFLVGAGQSKLVGRMLPQPRMGSGPNQGQRLDSLLKDGFCLLGIDITTETVNGISLGDEWDGVIASRMALSIEAVPVFADESGHFLLLRPDRYVIARFSPAEVAAVRAALADLRSDSWKPEAARDSLP